MIKTQYCKRVTVCDAKYDIVTLWLLLLTFTTLCVTKVMKQSIVFSHVRPGVCA